MEPMEIVNLLSRWIHVGTAIVLMGGAVFMRFVLLPAAAELPTAEHDALKGRLKARWKKFVMIGILLLLLSGFYNYLQVAAVEHNAAGDKRYHMFMGIKILLAFGVFFLASVLTGRSAKFEPMRKHPAKALTWLILLAAGVVGLAGLLKVRGIPTTAPTTPAPATNTTQTP
ncbi:MAG: hypothetical protein R3C01_16240 [Planctomycetaceae bacterium]